MQSTSALKDIRSLRRNRSGIAHNAAQTIRSSQSQMNGRSIKHRNVFSNNSSTSSSNGSSSGNTSYNGRRRNSLGMAERLLQLRKPRDDTYYEGVESMQNSLARKNISTTGRQSSAFQYPIFKMKYAKLSQDEEMSVPSENDQGSAGFLLQKMMICLFIIFITACWTTFFTTDHDAKAKQNNISQHNVVFQNHDLPSNFEQSLTELDSISNLTTSYDPQQEISFFVDIKLTGSTMVKRSISKCFNLTMACELGLRQPNYNDEELAVFPSQYMGYTGLYVNVDTSTKKGIQRSKVLNLTSSGLADVFSSPMPYAGNDVFRDGKTKARMFAVFAHPIARAIGEYYHIQQATWDTRYNVRVKSMTLLQFASSRYVEDNPMVRLLTNKEYPEKLSGLDLEIAKKIIEMKALIGLYHDLDGSIARFQRYFGWPTNKETQSCTLQLATTGEKWMTIHKGKVVEGDDIWTKFAQSNEFDITLYSFIEMLYKEQGKQIFDVVN